MNPALIALSLVAFVVYSVILFRFAKSRGGQGAYAHVHTPASPAPGPGDDALARKVSHDLKAPLAALGMLEADLKHLPEKSQLLVKSAIFRIQEIVDRLQGKPVEKSMPGSVQSAPSASNALAVHELRLPAEPCVIVVLDDDPLIHELWRQRFSAIDPGGQRLALKIFSNPGDFTDFVTEGDASQAAVFLVDHDLDGHSVTGLALIQSLNLAAKSILVTNRDEDQKIRATCQSLAVKLLPKTAIKSLPIVVGGHPQP